MNVSENRRCTGCAMCRDICPRHAVSMGNDRQGFLYPVIDADRCIDCNLCVSRCPVLNPPEISKKTIVLAGHNRDEAMLQYSSSGAVFPAAALRILERGGIVYGAAFESPYILRHRRAADASALDSLRSSKYVQSDLSGCYQQIRRDLEDGLWVYFSGTPCQCAAVKNYLGEAPDRLILQDVVCHSVPSPMVWKTYLTECEKAHDSKVRAVSFRYKMEAGEQYYIRCEYEDGQVDCQKASDNPYQKGFIRGLYSKSCCYECGFKGVDRCTDLTLADFWGAENLLPEAYHSGGTSIVMVHSEKGEELMKECESSLFLIETTADKAFTFNPAAFRSSVKPARYDEFWEGFGQEDFTPLTERCCLPTEEEIRNAQKKNSLWAKLRRRVFRLIPLVLLLMFAWELYQSNYGLTTTTYQIASTEIEHAFRITQISDLHGNRFGTANSKLIHHIAEISPDLILITGDLINYKASDSAEECERACALIRELCDIAPVYLSYGNHEAAYDEKNSRSIRLDYEEAGAVVLEKEYQDINVCGNSIRIGGLYGYGISEQYAEETHREEEAAFLREFEMTDQYKVMLCHIPVSWMCESLCDWDVDVVYSGHVHGGQVQIPGIGGLWGPDQGWFPGKDYGVYCTDETTWKNFWKNAQTWARKQEEKGVDLDMNRYRDREYRDRYLVLSRGLGNTDWMPRFNNVPEIVTVEHVSAEGK